jgi:hypothetical protein
MLHRLYLTLCVFALLMISTPAYATVITATPVNFNAVAGVNFSGPVATFTDSNAAATAANFTATIDWGDGTTSAGTITRNAQMFTVTGIHTYAMSGQETVKVTISDVPPGTGTAMVSETITVSGPKPPTLTKAFADSEIQLFGPSNSTTLSFTLTNPNTVTTLTGLAFTDTLPSGLVVATTYSIGSCGGGTITATAGANIISLSGATLATGASCTFSVNVTGTAIGVQTNTTSTVTSNEGPPGAPATASTSVDDLFFLWFFL